MGSVRSKHQVRIAREFDDLKATVHIGKSRTEMAKKFRNARLGSVVRGVSRFWGKKERAGCRPPMLMAPRKGALFEGSPKPYPAGEAKRGIIALLDNRARATPT